MKLKDRIAVITGAARGIGLAIAERFVAEGATVVISDVEDQAGSCRGQIHRRHLHALRRVEVRRGRRAGRRRRERKFGAIDILVNNAGIAMAQDFLEITEADYDRVLGINLKGSFLMLQACARQMVKQAKAGRKPGAIVNMSSVNDTLAIPTIVTYCISKGGVSQLTRSTSVYLAAYGIRVNAIGPGSIRTDMFKAVVNDRGRHQARHVANAAGPRRRALGSGVHRRLPRLR